MAQVLIEEKYLEDIADALRKKTGTNNTYTPAQMAETIRSLGTWSWVKDDGSHYFHLDIEDRWAKDQVLNLNLQGTINWGDGTTTTCNHSEMTQETHTYANLGKYIVHVTSNSGTSVVWGTGSFCANTRASYAVRCYELGVNWSNENGAFNNLNRCKYIFIHKYPYDPTSITGGSEVDLGTSFRGYRSLELIKCTTGISLTQSAAMSYPILKAFICPSVTVTGYGGVGGHSFPRIQYLGKGIIYNATGSIVNQSVFSGVGNLREFIRLPGGQAYLVYQNHLQGGTVCEKVVIPSSVTQIPSNAIQVNVKELHMLGTTPPTLSTTIPVTVGQTRIYVPTGSLSTYASATNWSQYAEYMLEE